MGRRYSLKMDEQRKQKTTPKGKDKGGKPYDRSRFRCPSVRRSRPLSSALRDQP
jgi:hypothetical protein